MVHEIETRILGTLKKEKSPISADRRLELVDKIVELIHIAPGTTSELIHTQITVEAAMNELEHAGMTEMARNTEGILEFRLVAKPSESITNKVEQDTQQETVINELGAAAVSSTETDSSQDSNPDSVVDHEHVLVS